MGINFGSYDQSITFVTFQQISDGAGGTIPTEQEVLTTFASVKQIRGGQTVESAQMLLPNTYQAKIQWRSTFSPNESMQVLYRGFYHKITGISLRHERMTTEFVFTMINTGKEVEYDIS